MPVPVCPFAFFQIPIAFNINDDFLDAQYYARLQAVHPDSIDRLPDSVKNPIQSMVITIHTCYQQLKKPKLRAKLLLEKVCHSAGGETEHFGSIVLEDDPLADEIEFDQAACEQAFQQCWDQQDLRGMQTWYFRLCQFEMRNRLIPTTA
jgi:hypothetical protein